LGIQVLVAHPPPGGIASSIFLSANRSFSRAICCSN
jgi:hypothetical protein